LLGWDGEGSGFSNCIMQRRAIDLLSCIVQTCDRPFELHYVMPCDRP
jgi:hypothetical protein